MVQKTLLLIDAVHITMGGGRVLLDYLCEKCVEKNVNFVLLRDSRCSPILREKINCEVEITGERDRKAYYKKHGNNYEAVLCFANIPPLVKLPCPVYTYFHNINLLKIPASYSCKRKMLSYVKRCYIAFYSRNTDAWIVQTSNMEECIKQSLPCNKKKVLCLPFYKSIRTDCLLGRDAREDYILVGDYTGTRGHEELLSAWRILCNGGFNRTLHLTVSMDSPFSKEIDKAQKEGVKVINHGIIPYNDVLKLYEKCVATIYPSVNESLGLGIIEAMEAGCDVIGINLPYIHAICEPSVEFDEITPEQIASAVYEYEREEHKKSVLKIENKIDEMLNCILNVC